MSLSCDLKKSDYLVVYFTTESQVYEKVSVLSEEKASVTVHEWGLTADSKTILINGFKAELIDIKRIEIENVIDIQVVLLKDDSEERKELFRFSQKCNVSYKSDLEGLDIVVTTLPSYS